MVKTSRITELATSIAENTELVDAYFESHGLPTPSLDAEAPRKLPIPEDAATIEAARVSVIEATMELRALMMGPAELLRPAYTDLVSLKAITRFNLDKAFPVGTETSYEAIAHFSGLDVRNTRRILRHGMTSYLFHEPRKNIVTHTGLTKLLAEDSMIHDNVANALDELWPAAVRTVDALAKWPGSEEPNETGFTLANNTTKSMWEVYAENPDRGKKFGRAMGAMAKVRGYEPHLLLEGYPWEDIGTGVVVDVGGSQGSVAISIAQRFPQLKCVVQDLPEVVEEGKTRLPSELIDRVKFQAHDFFTEQSIVADVYYFRSIFHNWSDKYSVRILRQLIPALKPNARVLIHEFVLPEPNTLSAIEEKKVRHMDIAMLQLLNSYQRDAEEWQGLFRQADSRFKYLGHSRPPGAAQSLIEGSWEG